MDVKIDCVKVTVLCMKKETAECCERLAELCRKSLANFCDD